VPILIHTLHSFQRASDWARIILVMDPGHIERWERVKQTHPLEKEPLVVDGGKERFHSVRNGLEKVPDRSDAIVAVHDAVRPLIRPERIEGLMKEAEEKGSAIPTIPLQESIRRVESDGSSRAVDRNSLRAVQTPQCFVASKLKAATEQEYRSDFTDEANVVEANGEDVHLAEGDPENIKITTPRDLRIGEVLMQDR
jgi:2-C-methyl-D-erythritol 4-phosphate cytidylyltransferase